MSGARSLGRAFSVRLPQVLAAARPPRPDPRCVYAAVEEIGMGDGGPRDTRFPGASVIGWQRVLPHNVPRAIRGENSVSAVPGMTFIPCSSGNGLTPTSFFRSSVLMEKASSPGHVV